MPKTWSATRATGADPAGLGVARGGSASTDWRRVRKNGIVDIFLCPLALSNGPRKDAKELEKKNRSGLENFDDSSACNVASETSPAGPWTYFQAACGRLGGASEERQPLQHGSSECSLPSQRKHATMGKGEGAKNKTSRQATTGTADVKIGMAKMLKGGVIMDVIDAEQARIVRYPCRLHFKSERCAKRPPKSRCAKRACRAVVKDSSAAPSAR